MTPIQIIIAEVLGVIGVIRIVEDNRTAKEQEARDFMIAKFEPLLVSYATKSGLARNCFAMKATEDALVDMLRRGADLHESDEMIVAMASIIGRLAISKPIMDVMTTAFDYDFEEAQKTYASLMRRVELDATNHAIEWLFKDSKPRLFLFWKKWDACAILKKSLLRYYPRQTVAT